LNLRAIGFDLIDTDDIKLAAFDEWVVTDLGVAAD